MVNAALLRVVFDSVIFVRAVMNPSGRWGRLVFERTGNYLLVVSPLVLSEVREVLQRPDLTRKYRALGGRDVNMVMGFLARAESVDVFAVPAVSRDPKDDKFLATAKAAGAAYLVTEDDDLLVLGEYEGTRIVTAAAFLAVLDERQKAQPPTFG